MAVQLDIGFGDVLAVEPVLVTIPPLLETLPAPRLHAYPPEASVAEKFEAMVKLGTRNSRMKDFHDIWALAHDLDFDGSALQRSIATCFERRGTPLTGELPEALTTAFYETEELATRWRSYLLVSRPVIAPPSSLPVLGAAIARFLAPVCASLAASRPFTATWRAGGPWDPVAPPLQPTGV
jgi:hypothetical protein